IYHEIVNPSMRVKNPKRNNSKSTNEDLKPSARISEWNTYILKLFVINK
ncbi:19390_t:CDS:1, partial [Gigaspora rosea]